MCSCVIWVCKNVILGQAVATEFYFGSFRGSGYNSNGVAVRTRSQLRQADPDLYNVIEAIFKCGNTYENRCPSRGKRQTTGDEIYNKKIKIAELFNYHKSHDRVMRGVNASY